MGPSPHAPPTISDPVLRHSDTDLLAYLTGLGIAATTREHAAVFTVAESASIKGAIPGAHSKNLFLKDRKGRLFLVVAKDDTAIDLKRLHEPLGASGRLSFGSAELLGNVLGVAPGSVTPFAAFNDEDCCVQVVLDRRLMGFPLVSFHPLRNTATTTLTPGDLLAFLAATGHDPLVLALPGPPDVPEG